MLDDKSVDVVFIAAPNHWHALAAIWAMQAGKDVYVEKPVSHNVSEGRRIVQVARKLGRICQGGTQNRSSGAWIEAIQYIRDGKLGEVKLARSIVYGRRGSIGGPGTCEIPPAVDYNLWLGPAAEVPLDPAQVPLRLALGLEHRQRRAREQQHPLARHLPVGPRRDGAGELRPQLRRAPRLLRRRRDAQHAGGRLRLRRQDHRLGDPRPEDRAVPPRFQGRLDLLRHRGDHRRRFALRPEGQAGPHLRPASPRTTSPTS